MTSSVENENEVGRVCTASSKVEEAVAVAVEFLQVLLVMEGVVAVLVTVHQVV